MKTIFYLSMISVIVLSGLLLLNTYYNKNLSDAYINGYERGSWDTGIYTHRNKKLPSMCFRERMRNNEHNLDGEAWDKEVNRIETECQKLSDEFQAEWKKKHPYN